MISAIIKGAIWMVVSTVIELLCAFLVAAFALAFFELSGVAFLAALTYWQLYWIQMAIYVCVGGATSMGIAAYEFMSD